MTTTSNFSAVRPPPGDCAALRLLRLFANLANSPRLAAYAVANRGEFAGVAMSGDQHLDGEGHEDRQPADQGGDDQLASAHPQSFQSSTRTNLKGSRRGARGAGLRGEHGQLATLHRPGNAGEGSVQWT